MAAQVMRTPAAAPPSMVTSGKLEVSERTSGPSVDLSACVDVEMEEELRRSPGSMRLWWYYIQATTKRMEMRQNADLKDAFMEFLCQLHERALRELPRCYKIWHNYLKLRESWVADLCVTDPACDVVEACYARAVCMLGKMPRIWEEYIEHLTRRLKITATRHVIYEALRSLPITQHYRVWALAMKMIRELNVPVRTGGELFRSYLMLEPAHAETYVAYLEGEEQWDEAARLLMKLVNDPDFVSMEGKSNHQLWLELCDMVTTHGPSIKSVDVDAVVRSAIGKFSDQTGRLWNSLADYYVQLGNFGKARDVYEEALESISTVRDFSLVFEAYQKFLENLVTVYSEMEEENEEGEDTAGSTADLLVEVLAKLIDRRLDLQSQVKLRQNPNKVSEWISRAKLFKDDPLTVIKTFAEGVKTVDPYQADGKLSRLWIEFANYYINTGKDIANARAVYEKAVKVEFRNAEELASVWCAWIEMEIQQKNNKQALEISRRAVGQYKGAEAGTVQAQLSRSVRLWHLAADCERFIAKNLDTTRAVYDKMIDLKVATPQTCIDYAQFEEDNKYFEKSFQVYERAVSLFRWPHAKDIWVLYLSKFTNRYKGSKLERSRELFDHALAHCPAKILSDDFEERYGLAKESLKILHRGVAKVEKNERVRMYNLLLAKTVDLLGAPATRPIYEEAIATLDDDRQIVRMCLQYSNIERAMGEIDRARAILKHCSQYCDPGKEKSEEYIGNFWNEWREFELTYGNADTYRELRRIWRSVMAQYSRQHFNATDISHQITEQMERDKAEGDDNDDEADPMAAAERQAERKRARDDESSGDSVAKRLRLQEEKLDFIESSSFTGEKEGFSFKMGARGLGYYRDLGGLLALETSRGGEDEDIELSEDL
ncbi:Pre-mRNA-splicing factor SYF1 [Perkinsus olseni]|uniref:Pre-mRNA-splicing factor SYF1 n=2 Tax=Perkinsus olseni TaxID=32597 RepID=A0A7J6P7C5_PEROL|nr:Pre-mRNA-splicing factor SYF1 [Perkinsus olseni]